MTIGELFIELGFKADTLKLKDFMRAVGDLNISSIATALGLGTLYEATAKIMGIADQAAMSVFSFGETTGISTKQMQQFSNVAEQLGGNSQDAQASLKNLQMAMLNVQLGRGNMEPFILAGIDPTKERNVFAIIDKIQKFLKDPTIADGVKRMVTAEFGLSESLIQVLKNTENITGEMQNQLYTNKAQIESMREFHKVNRELGQAFKMLMIDLAVAFEPIVTSLLSLGDAFIKILISPLDQIFTRVMNLVKAIETFISTVINAIPFGKNLIEFLNTIGNLVTNPLSKLLQSSPLVSGTGLALAGASSTQTVSNDIDIYISGVSDPNKASDLAIQKLQKMLTDRYYHQKIQER